MMRASLGCCAQPVQGPKIRVDIRSSYRFSHIRTEDNMSSSPAGPRIASGNSLQQGRNPSISPDTSSKHTTPGIEG